MIRGNTKKAIENATKTFLSYYDDKNDILKDAKACYWEKPFSWYRAGVKMAEGGAFACYNSTMFEEIADILELTEEEKAFYDKKLSNEAVFKRYCHMAGQFVERLAKKHF